jgi:hypothetical protein
MWGTLPQLFCPALPQLLLPALRQLLFPALLQLLCPTLPQLLLPAVRTVLGIARISFLLLLEKEPNPSTCKGFGFFFGWKRRVRLEATGSVGSDGPVRIRVKEAGCLKKPSPQSRQEGQIAVHMMNTKCHCGMDAHSQHGEREGPWG